MDVTSNPRTRNVPPRSRDPTRGRARAAADRERHRSAADSSVVHADDEDWPDPTETPASLPQVTESGPSRALYAFVGLTVLAGVGSLVGQLAPILEALTRSVQRAMQAPSPTATTSDGRS